MAIKLSTFRKMRYYISEATAIVIYKSTILPILDYNDIIYNLGTELQKDKIQKIQNRALRTVFRNKTMSTFDMHDQAKVKYLAERREAHTLALMYKRSKNEYYIDSTVRVTRQAKATLLKVPKAKLYKATKAPAYLGSRSWNELPPKIREATTFLGFKLGVKYWQAHRTQLNLNITDNY